MSRQPTEDEMRRVYRDTIDGLFRFTVRRCGGDRDLAEDITQETWLRAVRSWRSEGIPERPLAWLCTVAARLLSNHRRSIAQHPVELDGREAVAPDERSARDRTARRSLLERALRRLPDVQHRLLEAFHLEGRRIADIARDLGTSERSVEGRLRRARLRLRQVLESDPDTKETIS